MAGIAHWAATTPDATAILTLSKQITYGELDDRQKKVVGFARAGGLDERDRVAVLSANRPESLEVTVALLRAGIVPVPINPLLTEPEIAYVLEDSGATLLFTDRPLEHPALNRVVTFGDAYERCLDEAEPVEIGGFVRGRPMHYTSGTTGRSKGVWVDPMSDEDAGRLSEGFRSLWGLGSDEVHLVCSPLAHSAPHRFSMRTLEAGGTVVLQPKFDAASALAGIELFGVTSTFMVPTHLERILDLGPKKLRGHDLSSMRTLAHAGAPIRVDTKREILAAFPEGSVWEFYGSTEGQATRISNSEWLRKPGSVGTPLPGVDVLVLDDERRSVDPGNVGQVWVRDPNAERFRYWRDKRKTREAWRNDAFTVGDLGYLDGDGYLFLTGRKHDTIITGGVNVYPQEVEAVLLEHPAVAEAVVFGIANDEWGQEVRAHVVAAPNMPLDGERLRDWARDRLAGFKCPRAIEVVGELERTATGKVRRPS
jgi:long-chain acyl-CoA synthetase